MLFDIGALWFSALGPAGLDESFRSEGRVHWFGVFRFVSCGMGTVFVPSHLFNRLLLLFPKGEDHVSVDTSSLIKSRLFFFFWCMKNFAGELCAGEMAPIQFSYVFCLFNRLQVSCSGCVELIDVTVDW